MQVIIYLDDQQLELSRLTQEKGLQKLTTEDWKRNFLQKITPPFLEDFLAEINEAFKKSDNILCAFEVLNVDNLNKQQTNSVNLFEPSIRVLANFYGTEQVDKFQGKESKVDVIIDKEEVMKELSGFLLDSKNAFQCHNKEMNQAAAELKEKLMKEKYSTDKINKMVETFIDENSFTIPICYHVMVNKHEAKALYPNMMSLLELCVIIPLTVEIGCGFSVMKLHCTHLRASMLPSTLNILMWICLCGDSLTDDAFENVVDMYRVL